MTQTTANRLTARSAAVWWTERLEQGDKKKFAARLAELIERELEQYGKCAVHCDYDPDSTLLDALQYAGVECRGMLFSANGILPRKHTTLIRPGEIRPKVGYGNWEETILVGDEHDTDHG